MLYLDPPTASARYKRRGAWSHLCSDAGREELHAFAAALGVKRCWFSTHGRPHYDLRPEQAAAAVAAGARLVSARDLIRAIPKEA